MSQKETKNSIKKKALKQKKKKKIAELSEKIE